MLPGELHSVAPLGKRDEAWPAAVITQIGGLLVGLDKFLCPLAHVDVACPHNVCVIGRKRFPREKRCQLRDTDRLARLLVLGKGTRRTAEDPRTPADECYRSGVRVNRPFAGIALTGIRVGKTLPLRVPQSQYGKKASQPGEPHPSLQHKRSTLLEFYANLCRRRARKSFNEGHRSGKAWKPIT